MSSADAGTPTSPPNSLTFRSESHDPTSPTKKYASLRPYAFLLLHNLLYTVHAVLTRYMYLEPLCKDTSIVRTLSRVPAR